MLIDTDNLVSAESFQKDFDRYVAAASQGRGPIAVTKDSEVIGVFMAPNEYDALYGMEIAKLLSRASGGRPYRMKKHAGSWSRLLSVGSGEHDRPAEKSPALETRGD